MPGRSQTPCKGKTSDKLKYDINHCIVLTMVRVNIFQISLIEIRSARLKLLRSLVNKPRPT